MSHALFCLFLLSLPAYLFIFSMPFIFYCATEVESRPSMVAHQTKPFCECLACAFARDVIWNGRLWLVVFALQSLSSNQELLDPHHKATGKSPRLHQLYQQHYKNLPHFNFLFKQILVLCASLFTL